MSTTDRQTGGRPPITSHAEIEAAAFDLFAQHGFDETTLDDIASALGVGRRTLFRYFPSKNDIPWGRFDDSLDGLRRNLRETPEDIRVIDAVVGAIVEFNRLDEAAIDQHRRRMTLILRTPALQAHSALRYAQWRGVIADYVAIRRGVPTDSLVARIAGHAALAIALSAYEQWLENEADPLEDLLLDASTSLRSLLAD